MRSRWLTAAALAVPFAITVAALRGLTLTLNIFHGSDERVYHLPTIHQFAGQLPFPDLVNYPAAQTPLFHLLEAYAGQLIGYQLWRLRLVEVLISYGLAWALFKLLHARLGLLRAPAIALALTFVLSPYVFGPSFRVMTDNLATLLVVLALERLERFRQSLALAPYLVACACIGLAILTRQSAAFMLAVAGIYPLAVRLGARRLAAAGAGLLVAAAPAAALFIAWHGLVPKGGNPSSCGLCAAGNGPSAARGLLSAQTLELTLASLALYGAILFSPQAVSGALSARGSLRAWARGAKAWLNGGVAAALAGVLLLVIWPARPGPRAHSAGLIWNAARRLPTVHGSSLVFWVLVPLSGVVIVWRMRVSPRRWPFAAFLGCFALGALAIRLPWQKYVDPFALLALLLTVRPTETMPPVKLVGAAALAAGSVGYAISLAA